MRELKHHNIGKLGQRQQRKNEIQSGGLDALMKTTTSWNYSFGTKNPRRNMTGPRAGTHGRTRTEDRAVGSEPEAEHEVEAWAHVLLADASAHQTEQKNQHQMQIKLIQPQENWRPALRFGAEGTGSTDGFISQQETQSESDHRWINQKQAPKAETAPRKIKTKIYSSTGEN
jgi:hypothetical protein